MARLTKPFQVASVPQVDVPLMTPGNPSSATNAPSDSADAPSAEVDISGVPGSPTMSPQLDVDHPSNSDIDSESIAWLNALENDELSKNLNVCVERWKSASPESRKKMFALFAIAGVFVAVCRHGHVLLVCDMIRSGEL